MKLLDYHKTIYLINLISKDILENGEDAFIKKCDLLNIISNNLKEVLNENND